MNSDTRFLVALILAGISALILMFSLVLLGLSIEQSIFICSVYSAFMGLLIGYLETKKDGPTRYT